MTWIGRFIHATNRDILSSMENRKELVTDREPPLAHSGTNLCLASQLVKVQYKMPILHPLLRDYIDFILINEHFASLSLFSMKGSDGCNQNSQPLNDAANGATGPRLIFVFSSFFFLVVLSSFWATEHQDPPYRSKHSLFTLPLILAPPWARTTRPHSLRHGFLLRILHARTHSDVYCAPAKSLIKFNNEKDPLSSGHKHTHTPFSIKPL